MDKHEARKKYFREIVRGMTSPQRIEFWTVISKKTGYKISTIKSWGMLKGLKINDQTANIIENTLGIKFPDECQINHDILIL